MEPISIKALLDLTHNLELKGVPYLWGGKSYFNPNIPNHVRGIDCSGFVQLAAYIATDKKVKLPEGSVEQHEKLNQDLNITRYSSVDLIRSALYICFIEPENGHAGHVFFVWNGWTCESHGGKGVDRRPWNTPVLEHEVKAVYLWPHIE